MGHPKDQCDAIGKLELLVKDMPQLSAEEQTLVREVLEAYRGWLVLGKALKLMVIILAGISAVFVASGHIRAALKEWLV